MLLSHSSERRNHLPGATETEWQSRGSTSRSVYPQLLLRLKSRGQRASPRCPRPPNLPSAGSGALQSFPQSAQPFSESCDRLAARRAVTWSGRLARGMPGAVVLEGGWGSAEWGGAHVWRDPRVAGPGGSKAVGLGGRGRGRGVVFRGEMAWLVYVPGPQWMGWPVLGMSLHWQMPRKPSCSERSATRLPGSNSGCACGNSWSLPLPPSPECKIAFPCVASSCAGGEGMVLFALSRWGN